MLTNKKNLFPKLLLQIHMAKMLTNSIKRSVQMSFNEYKPLKGHTNKSSVIIMHCIMGSKSSWHDFALDLAMNSNRKIFCVDARNHGSSQFTNEHSSQHLAADVREFCKDKCLEKVTLMGHGMGGRAMMFFALKYPTMVDRAIIVDISPVAIPKDYLCLHQIFIIMKGLEIPPDTSLADARHMVAEVFTKVVTIEKNAHFLAMNLQKNSEGKFYWSINIDVLQNNLRQFAEFNIEPNVKPFQGPTSFICGKQSNFVDGDSFSLINTLFPKSEIHWLDAEDLVPLEQPKQFMDLIIQFLKK